MPKSSPAKDFPPSRRSGARPALVGIVSLVILAIAAVTAYQWLYRGTDIREFAFRRFDTQAENEMALARFRARDPKAYLSTVLRKEGYDAWMAALASLEPQRYQAELRKQAENLTAKQAANAALTKEGAGCRVTLAQFQELSFGISYKKAVDILGCNGTVLSEVRIGGAYAVMYQWRGGFIANMNAEFENGRLVSKAQFGLM
jgi:hypothetical protein